MKKLSIISLLATLTSAYGNGLMSGPSIHIVSIVNETDEDIALYSYTGSDRDNKILKRGTLFISSMPQRARAKSIMQPILALESHLKIDQTNKSAKILFDSFGLSIVTKKYNGQQDWQNPDLYISLTGLEVTPDATTFSIQEAITKKSSTVETKRPATESIANKDIIIGWLTIGKSGNALNYTLKLSTDYQRFYRGEL